jgi:hypothetical protein
VEEALSKLARSLKLKHGRVNTPITALPKKITRERFRIALSLTGSFGHFEPTTSISRLMGRFFGESANGSRVQSLLSLARIIGTKNRELVYASLLEIADQFCRATVTHCAVCPLNVMCRTATEGRAAGAHEPTQPALQLSNI